MKGKHLLNLLLSVSVGLMAGYPPASLADDTDIYLGVSAGNEEIRPNVLFILDTSGSMSDTVSGTGMDRLDNMKAAMNRILTEANNINVGLMRFTDPGGPVLWPVSYIDEDVDVVTGAVAPGMEVNVRILPTAADGLTSTDDAIERASHGMDLTSTQLELGKASEIGAEVTQEVSVAAQTDNAEEQLATGNTITQNYINMQADQINGVRFQGLNIPVGAQILEAKITFTASGDSYSDAAFKISGENVGNSAAFYLNGGCNGCWNVAARYKTYANEVWEPTRWRQNNQYDTPDLSRLVQEIVGPPGASSALSGWAPGNAMGFLLDFVSGSESRAMYTYQGAGGYTGRRAKLTVRYAPVTAAAQNEYVGLRFQDVAVPKGATITNAYIEFAPEVTSGWDDDPAGVKVWGEKVADAPTFESTDSHLTGRMANKTDASVDWNSGNATMSSWYDIDATYQTPDLRELVQEIVNQDGWCGNNAMAFLLEKDQDGPRIAKSYEGDPSKAPILRIDYDEDSIPADTCIQQWVQRQIAEENDDAEQSGSSIYLGGNTLNMNSSQTNGLRFQNLPIAQGETILEARLILTADDDDTGSTTLRLYGDDSDDAAAFANTYHNISSRTKTGAYVDWVTGNWSVVGAQYTSPDLKDIVQEIVDRGGWQSGNALAFIQTHESGGSRDAVTYHNNPAQGAILRVKIRGTRATAGTGVKTVRQEMMEIIDNFDHSGHTPIVDTLYEAARYYRGEGVYYGLSRGKSRNLPEWNSTDNPAPNSRDTNENVRENTRISHEASWTGGTVTLPLGCDNANSNASACANIRVDGDPTYVSPIKEECQANYVVLLTDGEANHNHSEQEIRSMTGVSSCTGTNRDERCGVELADYLNNQDQSTLAGDQTVTTYTIGFNFSGQFLRDLASRGGGRFYEASNADNLAAVFQAIIVDILSRTTSFATPSLTVNAFNKLFHRDDVYFSLFKPVGQVGWKGNVKKYRICDGSDASCTFGDIMDAAAAQAIGTDDRISDTARSYWSDSADGSVIDVGGAGGEVVGQGWDQRTVLTYTGSLAPSNVTLSVDAHKLVSGSVSGESDNPNVTKGMLGDSSMSDTERTDLIDWIRGKDLNDEDEDGATDDTRFLFGDPLHSSPVAVTYGGTATEPVTKLFVGTNDGALRMINGYNGKEEWAFYPQTALAMQKDLRDNFNGDHKYGMDGTPTVWVNDADEDGVIETADGDFVRVYATMRRGGRNIYAFDVTPASPIAASQRDTLGLAMPKLMWRIEGGSPGDYPQLGYTWSRPKLSTIPFGTTTEKEVLSKTVLVFAGGYDGNGDTQDSGFGPDSPGNAIYIADAATGARLLSVSNALPSGGSGTTVSVNVSGGPVMGYPIPSEVAMFDSNGDGDRDRIYVGDTGGQVWRVDLEPNITTTAGLIAKVRLFAQVSDGANVADRRKFFYRPDVVQVTDNIYSNTARYDLVTLGSGNRADPLNTDVDDMVVALRDRFVDSLPDSDGDGVADADIDGDGTDDAPLTLTDLFPATEFFNSPTGDDLTGSNGLKQAEGWYIDLEANGEKGLAPPVVLAGRMFFTSYLPEGVVNTGTCTISEGAGRLYGVNLLTGAAFPWDLVNNDTVTGKESRYMSLGSGIPSEAVPIFMPKGVTLLIGSGGGAKTVDPGINLAREQTYWYR